MWNVGSHRRSGLSGLSILLQGTHSSWSVRIPKTLEESRRASGSRWLSARLTVLRCCVGGCLGHVVKNGVPQHGHSGLKECDDVGLGSGDTRVDVCFISGEERREVGLEDPCRTLLWKLVNRRSREWK